jgi:hypothetical protein
MGQTEMLILKACCSVCSVAMYVESCQLVTFLRPKKPIQILEKEK